MSSVLKPDPQRFPVGTTVKAYAINPESAFGRRPSGKPPGAVVSEAAVAAGGAVTLALPEGAHYLCWAEVGGESRYFKTYVPTPLQRRELEAGTGISIESNRISATGSSSAPAETNLGEVSGAVKIDLAQENLGLQRMTLNGDATIELTKPPATPFGVSIIIGQDATGGRKWTVNLAGKPIQWVGGTTEPIYPTTKGTSVLLTVLVVGGGTELLGITGLPGPKGDEGKEGPEGGKPTFHEIESLGTGVTAFGGEYAPPGYAVSQGVIRLTGLAKVTLGLLAGGVLFTLPVGARPSFKKLIWVPNGETTISGVLFIVEKNGQVKAAIEIGVGFAAVLDGVSFSLEH